ncbi:MAG: flagellar hook-length control protein FliK [Thermodesulfovibrionales bacterium]
MTLNPGEVVKAEVINLLPSGDINIRIKGKLLSVKSEISLDIGQIMTLKVKELSGDGFLRLQIIGSESVNAKESLTERIQSILQNMDKAISGNIKGYARRFDKLLSELSKAIPEDPSALPIETRFRVVNLLLKAIKKEEGIRMFSSESEILGLKHIEELLRPSAESRGLTLKELLENTGILFETRLKKILEDGKLEEGLLRSLREDLKANLLRLAEESEIDKGIAKIETFQALSKVTDSFFTFLPIIWKELKDGDISFKKRGDGRGEKTFTCRLNLNLEGYGELAVMITLQNKNFFVSFAVENQGLQKLIEQNRELLYDSFAGTGLNLKAINVTAFDAKFLRPYIVDRVDYRV